MSNETIICVCGWYGLLTELNHTRDFERTHPANKDIAYDEMLDGRGHWTEFDECPNCGRVFFADDKLIRSTHPRPNQPEPKQGANHV